MTKTMAKDMATLREANPLELQRDREGQFFNFPEGWKFTNGKVIICKVAGGLLLTPVKPGKLKLPQASRQPMDYPKQATDNQK